MNIRPAGDGWRAVADCAGGCGASVVCLPVYIGRARCGACGRQHHRALADGTRTPPDRTPVSMPSRMVHPVEVAAPESKIRRGLIEEWALDDARLPAGARGFVADLARAGIMSARVCHTVALDGAGNPIETVGIHWGGGVAFWTKHDTPRVRHEVPRKIDLTRTATGRRRVQRFDPKVWWTGGISWTGEVYALARMTVTQTVLALRARMGT